MQSSDLYFTITSLIVPKNSSRNNRRRGTRKNRGSGGNAIPPMALTEAFQRQLANHDPKVVIKTQILEFAQTSGSVVSIPLIPANLGARIQQLTGCFSRWRVVKAIAVYKGPYATTTNGTVHIGWSDDYGGEGGAGVVPTTASDISTLRCAGDTVAFKDLEVLWKPIDPEKWFYVFGTATGLGQTDYRLVCPATLWTIRNFPSYSGPTFIDVRLLITVEFAGASY
jgi:hypothetical protein